HRRARAAALGRRRPDHGDAHPHQTDSPAVAARAGRSLRPRSGVIRAGRATPVPRGQLVTAEPDRDGIRRLRVGIPGFDLIASGGLPRARTTLVAGTAGSAKTVFASQFLAEGIARAGESGVFVTFEETPSDIRGNMLGFGWDIAHWEADGR